jgi:hypothetical protein
MARSSSPPLSLVQQRMTQAAIGRVKGGRHFWLYSIIALPLTCVLLISWDAAFMHTASGDDATTYLLHHLFRKVHYGTDLFSPAGPWSIIYFPQYHPDTFWILIAGQAAIGGLLSSILVVIAARHTRSALAGALFLVGSLGVFMLAQDARYFFLCLGALLFAPDADRRSTQPVQLLIITGMALGFLIKGTFLIAALVVGGFVFLNEIAYLRRLPIATVVFVAAVVSLNAAANQSLADLVPYIGHGIDTAEGYPERYSELGSPIELAAFALAAVPLWLAIAACEMRRASAWGAVATLAYTVILFLLFKTGFVRQDGQHVIRAFGGLLVFGASYVLVRRDTLAELCALLGYHTISAFILGRPAPHRWRSLSLTAGLIAIAVIVSFFAWRYPSLYTGKLDKLTTRVESMVGSLHQGRAYFAEGHQRAIETIRGDYPLPALSGSVVVFSALQTPAIAHALAITPLPSTAPGLAMSPRGEESNAVFFDGPRAPDYVLFQDAVFAIYRGGVSLLENYVPGSRHGGFLVFEKARQRRHTLVPLGATTAAWGTDIAIPDAGAPIWARIDYSPTLLATILGILYQPPPAYLVFIENGKEVLRLRATRALLASGFIAAPVPATSERLVTVAPPASRAIRLDVGEPGSWLFPAGAWTHYFRPDIRASLFQLLIEPAFAPDAGK